jgi:hypothetical protein
VYQKQDTAFVDPQGSKRIVVTYFFHCLKLGEMVSTAHSAKVMNGAFFREWILDFYVTQCVYLTKTLHEFLWPVFFYAAVCFEQPHAAADVVADQMGVYDVFGLYCHTHRSFPWVKVRQSNGLDDAGQSRSCHELVKGRLFNPTFFVGYYCNFVLWFKRHL